MERICELSQFGMSEEGMVPRQFMLDLVPTAQVGTAVDRRPDQPARANRTRKALGMAQSILLKSRDQPRGMHS
jgi:hypothetical protein